MLDAPSQAQTNIFLDEHLFKFFKSDMEIKIEPCFLTQFRKPDIFIQSRKFKTVYGDETRYRNQV